MPAGVFRFCQKSLKELFFKKKQKVATRRHVFFAKKLHDRCFTGFKIRLRSYFSKSISKVLLRLPFIISVNMLEWCKYKNLNLKESLFNPLSAKPAKWSNTLKQFVGNLPTSYLNVCDYFLKLGLKGLRGHS